MIARRVKSRRESGQAAVESALTLPLTIFLILGTLQLFMMLQARIMAQYAAYQAVRAGSLHYGNCLMMDQAALLALMPTIQPIARPDLGTPAKQLAKAFQARYKPTGTPHTKYSKALDSGYSQPIVEIVREEPTVSYLTSLPSTAYLSSTEDTDFDQLGKSDRLEIRMLYWYRLRIPFADWVMSRMFLAHYGIKSYTKANPLMETQTANWTGDATLHGNGAWPGGSLSSRMRTWANKRQYLFPIQVSAVMRMLTPPKKKFFSQAACNP